MVSSIYLKLRGRITCNTCHRFSRSHLYSSFNVMDLHTVDRGVESHLEEEVAQPDWEVMVAHFLGVDHCGHRYGPNHPQMAAKLTQMNEVVK